MCEGCGVPGKPAHRVCLAKYQGHRSGDEDDSCMEVEFMEFAFTHYLLDTSLLEKKKEELHERDLATAWIGLPFLQRREFPHLHVWPRLQQLLDTAKDPPPRQYPSLVSFIGDTGSGKSTLIRAMIQLIRPKEIKKHSLPIPGFASDIFESTTSDVHVYADPRTLATENPMFFVGTLTVLFLYGFATEER